MDTFPEIKLSNENGFFQFPSVLCALVNSLVPGTFTTDVLLNDR